MKTYVVNYGTGVFKRVKGTLEDAKKVADNGAAYTGSSITISENSKEVCIRKWWGVRFLPELYEGGEDTDVIKFGNYGYYDPWRNV